MSSIPRSFKTFSTTSAGRGVILSIMVQGKDTFPSSVTQSRKPPSTKPFSCHFSAMVTTPLRTFSPLWEQLSVLTTARGKAPALYRSSSSAATQPMARVQFPGPAAKSFSAMGVNFPDMSFRA